jgi:hypothetical protein
MLIAETNKTVKNVMFDDIYTPSIQQKSDKAKEQEAAILSLQRIKNLNRFLEANCDCV